MTKWHYVVLTFLLCSFIQWHAHYLSPQVEDEGLSTILRTFLVIIYFIIPTHERNS